jgi:RecJ-like exonuclease
LLHRLTASAHYLDAAELRSEVERLACVPVDHVHSGDVATVTGRIRAVVYTPTEHVPTLTAELWDGTVPMDLVWLGRRRIAGIEPGRRITVRGRVGTHAGRPAIYNPWYELQGAPSE